LQNQIEKDIIEDLFVYGRVILKLILENQVVRKLNWCSWLKVESAFVIAVMKIYIPLQQGIFHQLNNYPLLKNAPVP